MSAPKTARKTTISSQMEKKNDEAIIQLIKGLNILIAQSKSSGIGSATRILATAKEDLVHFAVNLNCQESLHEQFINRHIYDASPYIIGEILTKLTKIKDDNTRECALDALGLKNLNQ